MAYLREDYDSYFRVGKMLAKKWSPLLEGLQGEYNIITTAILLENQTQGGGQADRLDETTLTGGSTASGPIAPFQHYLLPLVRRVYPNLITNELVGVQPMTSPASLVFYLKYRYGGLVDATGTAKTKGKTAPKTEYGNFVGNTWQVDPYYSLQTNFAEAVTPALVETGAGPYTYTQNNIAVNANPVLDGTVSLRITIDNAGTKSVYSFAQGSAAAKYVSGAALTINSFSLVVDNGGLIDFNFVCTTTGLTADDIAATYDYDMENNKQLPEIDLEVTSSPVTAKTRKLRTKWSVEASQDLRAMHNIDAEKELVALLANEIAAEIDREVLDTLIRNAAIRVNYDYSDPFIVGGALTQAAANASAGGTAVFAVPGATNFDDRNRALFYQILEVSNQIYRQSLRGAGNWVVTSPELAAKLESLKEFKPGDINDFSYNLGIQASGTLNNKFKLYKDPLFRNDLILVGFKGSSFMDSGFFYCPYIPLQLTPTVLDPDSFNPRKGLITRYGAVMVENGARMYGVIRVDNLTAKGANELPGKTVLGTTTDAKDGLQKMSQKETKGLVRNDSDLI